MKDDKMSSKTPFVKKFEEGGNFFLYDVNSNQIVEVEQPVYDLIDFAHREDAEDDVVFESGYSKRAIKECMEVFRSVKTAS